MSGRYIIPSPDDFLPLSGGTVSGTTFFTDGLFSNTLSGGTIFSGSTDLSVIIQNIASGVTAAGNFLSITGGTGGPYLFTGGTTAGTLTVITQVKPSIDNMVDLGTPIKRFRSLNTVDGIAVNFTASTRLTTPEIVLGNTSVKENNILLSGYCLNGGEW